jgi:hypothetical protein
MKKESKKIIVIAIILSMLIVGVGYAVNNNIFPTGSINLQSIDVNPITYYTTLSKSYNPGKGHVFIKPPTTHTEMVSGAKYATAWISTTALSEPITIEPAFTWVGRWDPPPGWGCGDSMPSIAMSGIIYTVTLVTTTGARIKIIDTANGLWYDSKYVDFSSDKTAKPNPDFLLGNGHGYMVPTMFTNQKYVTANSNSKMYRDVFVTKYPEAKTSWDTYISGKRFIYESGNSGTILGPPMRFCIKGQVAGKLEILALAAYAERIDYDGWGCVGGRWTYGSLLIARDEVALLSGQGSVEIKADNSEGIHSTANPEVFNGDYNANTQTVPIQAQSYPKRIFQEGETVKLVVTTGYTGEPSTWTLAFWDAHGRPIPDATRSLPNNAERMSIDFKIPDNCFDASLGLNEFTIVLTNGLFRQGTVYAFVVDTKERLPGKATVTVNKQTFLAGETISCVAWAAATPASGPIYKFRWEARYDSYFGPLVFSPIQVNAYPDGGVYKSQYSFTASQAGRDVWIMANALAGDPNLPAYPGLTSDPVLVKIETAEKYWNVRVVVKDSSGNGIIGATVQLGETKKTTGAGGIALFLVKDGNYIFQVSKKDYTSSTPEVLYVARDMEKPVTLAGGAPSDEPKEGDDIKIVVHYQTLDASTLDIISSAQVTLTNSLGDKYTQWTDAAGLAKFDGILVGTYNYTIIKEGYDDFTGTDSLLQEETIVKYLFATGESPEPGPIPVPEPDGETVTVSITVKGSLGAIANADVTLSGTTSVFDVYKQTTSSAGVATLYDVKLGSYDLLVSADGYDIGWKQVTVSASSTTFDITLTGGGQQQSGATVTISTGVSFSNVALSGRADFSYYDAEADSLGYARFQDVKTGAYDIFASADGYYPASDIVSVIQGENNFALQMEIVKTDPVNNVVVDPPVKDEENNVIDPEPVNGGFVDKNTGKPVYTIVLKIKDEKTGAGVASCYVLIGSNVRLTNSVGEISIQLTEGAYNIKIVKDNYQTKISSLVVSQDGTHTINIQAGEPAKGATPKQTPGFELLSLIVALGITFILLKRRKKKSEK